MLWKVCAAAAATALLAITAARAEDPRDVPGKMYVPREADVLSNDLGVVTNRSEYWLGLFTTSPSPALQSQLKLPKDQGLLVEGLQPDSPAVKAGLQQYDILLKGNDKPLNSIQDLVQLIDQVKEGKLTLDVLRAGKHETVTATPAKRPANEPGAIGGILLPEGAGISGLTEGRPLEIRVIRPGAQIVPGGPVTALPGAAATNLEFAIYTKLADGSKVEITRHGAEPAKVVVTHDKEKWEGTAKDLSKIPEKIRPEIERLLYPAFELNNLFARTGEGTVTIGGFAPATVAGAGIVVAPNVEKRLGELQKQVDELRRSVEALQGKTEKKAESKSE